MALAVTSLIVRFTGFLAHKSLFTKGFWLVAAEIALRWRDSRNSQRGPCANDTKLDSLKAWRQIFGVAKGFCPNFPKLPRNDFYAIFDYTFSPTKIMTTVFGVTSKKGLHVFFCKPWASFFEVKQRSAPFLRGCSGMLPNFQKIKTFGGALAPPPPTPLLFITVSQVISQFIKIDSKQIYCSFSSTHKIQNFFL